jgi:hypothetical protein
MADSRIINVRRLSYELSGAVDEREITRVRALVNGIDVCPRCGESATPESVIAPPVTEAEFESELLRESALSDDHVDVRFEPCGDEIDIREIDGLDVRIRDGPIEIDYDPSPA